MQRDSRTSSLWPERLIEYALEARRHPPAELPAERESPRTRLWLLLHSVLSARIRTLSRRLGPVPDEEIEDLASQKALELLMDFDRQRWRPESAYPGEAHAFVTAVARNGLVDSLRRSGRFVHEPEYRVETHQEHHGMSPDDVEDPTARVERQRFAAALLHCAQALKARDRTIWFFRVFYDMSSKRIAAHPEVAPVKPAHVDVILQRCRERIRACMETSGYDPHEVPPGTFSELWRAFRAGMETPPPAEGRIERRRA